MFGAMDRVTQARKEDRMGHGRGIPFFGEMIFLHAKGFIGAGGCRVFGNASRYWPNILLSTVNADCHLLALLVYRNEHLRSIGWAGTHEKQTRHQGPKLHRNFPLPSGAETLFW